MSNKNLNEKQDNVNIILENNDRKIERDLEMKKIKEEVLKKFAEYRNTINYMVADAPLGVLCLPNGIEKALRDYGCIRIYDLFDLDFTKVKGLGVVRIGHLTTCLDKFFAML